MGEVKHVTKDGVIIYTDGSEIGIEQITTRAIETGDDVSKKNLRASLERLLKLVSEE